MFLYKSFTQCTITFRNEAASTFSSQTTLSIEGQQSTNTTIGQVGQESNADSGCLVLNRDLDSSAVASEDFGKVPKLKTTHKLTDVPAPNYVFPARIFQGNARHFQHSWLTKYPGLVYSASEDGGFCKYCILFARCEASVKELGVLVNRPLKKAIEILSDHFYNTSKGCSRGRVSPGSLPSVMENQLQRIDHQLSSEREKQTAENRLELRSIAETALFSECQGIALRGHQDGMCLKVLRVIMAT